MNIIEVSRKIVSEHSAHLVRERKDAPRTYDAKLMEGNKRGWVMLDAFTASAIVQIYDNLNEANREKYAGLEISKLIKVTYGLLA